MDHGHDAANVASFSTPLTHRVVTVSAADLLSPSPASSTTSETPALASVPSPSRFISTGIETLDAILAGIPPPATRDDGDASPKPRRPVSVGGVRRGQITEIWGPPGSGKSTFGMQLAANALRDGRSVTWIDCFQPLCEDRLATLIEYQLDDKAEEEEKDVQDRFARYACPSLAHFIAMLCPPPPAHSVCLPDASSSSAADSALLVIDSLSALVNYALPRTADRKAAPLMANGRRGPSTYDKRTQVIQYITAALERLAETRNLAVVVLTQCATRIMQAERGAGLAPSLSADVWNRGIAARLVLFRDWAWHAREHRPVAGRFAGVQKRNGHASAGESGLDAVVAFDIAADAGLVQAAHCTVLSPRRARTAYKRKRGENEHENVNVIETDDDYGWDEALANSLPQMPPQWQGSEDIMLGHRYDDDDDDEEEEEEDGEDEEGAADAIPGDGAHVVLQHIPRRRSQSVADSEADSDL